MTSLPIQAFVVKRKVQNQKGFVLIYFMYLGPFCLLLALGVFFTYQLMSTYSHFQNKCRHTVLEIQKQFGAGLQEILELNQAIEQVLKEEDSLLKELTALESDDSNPYGALYDSLLQNQRQQYLLRKKQNKILMKDKSITQQILFRFQNQIIPYGSLHHTKLALNIKKQFPQRIISPFTVPQDFSKKQNLIISWKIPLKNFLAPSLLRLFFKTSPLLSHSCSATLLSKGNVWNPKLTSI